MLLFIIPMQVSLSLNFCMVRSTVCTFIKDTCEVVSRVLTKEYVKALSCALDWEGISREFEKRWNFLNCVGMYIHVCSIHCSYTSSIMIIKFISRND